MPPPTAKQITSIILCLLNVTANGLANRHADIKDASKAATANSNGIYFDFRALATMEIMYANGEYKIHP